MKIALNACLFTSLLLFLCGSPASAQLDQLPANGISDVFDMMYPSGPQSRSSDGDMDGRTYEDEAAAATNPMNAASFISARVEKKGAQKILVSWDSVKGKVYQVFFTATVAIPNWQPVSEVLDGTGEEMTFLTDSVGEGFFNVKVTDTDTDGDGLYDWEELMLLYNPNDRTSYGSAERDDNTVEARQTAPAVITVGLIDHETSEDWRDPAVFRIHRSGGLNEMAVNFTISGSATNGTDYEPLGGTAVFPVGKSETWVEVKPLEDAVSDNNETVMLTLQNGTGYTVGSPASATVTIKDADANNGLPSEEEAIRFLCQATLGPVEADIQRVMEIGYEAWIDEQFSKPQTQHQPTFESIPGLQYGAHKADAWWKVVMTASDPLRQRVAYALSQIFVISDALNGLNNNPRGMLNYYDMLLDNSFGNYRVLLEDVSRHPAMGLYLSHLRNLPANEEEMTFPDENYAREVKQLFSIGTVELNMDGSLILDGNGQPVPTYTNDQIREFARVFTGFTLADRTSFNYGGTFFKPMEIDDGYHDMGAKTLLVRSVLQVGHKTHLPANQGGDQDLSDAMDNLFYHPNVGPFIGRLLIQRLVKSHPSPNYISRVSAAFNNNGSGVRGDMKAVIKAILLDPEARDYASLEDPMHGMLTEPYGRIVRLARTFNASARDGSYSLRYLDNFFNMQPLSSPSVFNFYLPGYRPPGVLRDYELDGPEFQITTADFAVKAPNYYWDSIEGDLNRWGSGGADPDDVVFDFSTEIALAQQQDCSALIAHLDRQLCYDRMPPAQIQLVRDRVNLIPTSEPDERVFIAVHLIVLSPAFAVQL